MRMLLRARHRSLKISPRALCAMAYIPCPSTRPEWSQGKAAFAATGVIMNTMTDSLAVMRINAQCHPLVRYLNKLSGIRYSALYEQAGCYELNPLYGKTRHATDEELANTEVWERLP